MSTRIVKKPRFSAVSCLLACGGLGMGVHSARCQPPTRSVQPVVETIERDWRALRRERGEREFLAPQESIARYQHFYEQAGFRSGQTAIEITGVIAQLYWQGLDNPQKALEIYDWGIREFASYPGLSNLVKGRDAVAGSGAFTNSFDLSPMAVPAMKKGFAKGHLQPVTIAPPAPAATTGVLAPVTLPGARTDSPAAANVFSPVTPPGQTPASAAGENKAIAPVTLTPPPVAPNDLNTVAVPATGPQKFTAGALAPVLPSDKPKDTAAELHAVAPVQPAPPASERELAAVTLPAKNAPAPAQNLAPVTLDSKANSISEESKTIAPVALAPLPSVQTNVAAVTVPATNAPALAALPSPLEPPASSAAPLSARTLVAQGIDPHQLALATGAGAVRAGNKTIAEFLEQLQPTAQDALWMLAAPGVIVSWKEDAPLRRALIGLIQQQAPELLQTPEKLPQPTRLALAEYYAAQRSPKAEKIYQAVLQEEFPAGTWWPKLWVMNAFAEYYGAMGEYVKAAQAKLRIGEETTAASWQGNIKVEAARFYMQAGETEKAQELYKQAEQSSFGWAAGIALMDQARLLMSQGQHEKARELLKKPIDGQLAGQVEPIKQMLLGDSYYATGDLEKARQYLQEAVTQYRVVPSPVPGEGLEAIFAAAAERLRNVERWIKEPIQVEPKELLITVGTKEPQDRPIIRRSRVRTLRAVPLEVSVNTPGVQARVVSGDGWDNVPATADKDQEVIVEIAPEAVKDGLSFMLVVSSPQIEKFQAQVPVKLQEK